MRLFLALLWDVLPALAAVVVGYLSLPELEGDQKAVAVIALAIIGGTAVVNAIWSRTVARWEREGRDMDKVLLATLNAIVSAVDAGWDSTGIHVFVARRMWPRQAFKRYGWRNGWRYLGRPYLKRIGTARHADVLPSTGVVWTKGKGVVGVCWRENDVYGRPLAEDFGTPDYWTQEEWEAEDDDFRDGLSWDEFARVAKREYGGVLAYPIQAAHDQAVGCVSVDVLAADYDKLISADNKADVLAALKAAAEYARDRGLHHAVSLPWDRGAPS